jgi:hypothetical protein|tara:strand:- start:10870 stop:11166 length:297 start_codon:yes stop_codon:yes gene_type:complete
MIEPLSLMSIAIIHIGSKYLTLELTDYQKKLLKSPIAQLIILLCIIYTSTKDILKTIIIVLTIYLFIYVILNENHPMSIVLPNINIKKRYLNSMIINL